MSYLSLSIILWDCNLIFLPHMPAFEDSAFYLLFYVTLLIEI